MRVCGDLVVVSTRARLVPRGALLDQREHGAILDQRNSQSADRVADEERGGVSSKGAAFGLTGGGGKPRGGWALSLDRGGARGAFESDLVRVCGDLAGVSTRARLVPRRALLDQREHGAILDQRDYGALPLLGQRNSQSADRVGDEERGGVSRSGDGSRGLGRGQSRPQCGPVARRVALVESVWNPGADHRRGRKVTCADPCQDVVVAWLATIAAAGLSTHAG